MNIIAKWVKDILTEPDGSTICPIRTLAITGFIYALCMSGWSVIVLKVAFSVVDFGTSYGVMLAALGVALGLKTDSTKEASKVVAS